MPDPLLAPIQITLYDSSDEVLGTYSRTRVSAELMLQAIELAEKLQAANIDEGNLGAREARQYLEALGAFVVEAFGSQFKLSDVMGGASPAEMLNVLVAVTARSQAVAAANPPARPARTNHPKRR